jgi:chromosome segregation ATPase
VDLKELSEQILSQEEGHQASITTIASLDGEIKSYTTAITEKEVYISTIEREMTSLSQANLEDQQRLDLIVTERQQIEDEMKPFEEEVKKREVALAEITHEIKVNANTISHLNVDLDGAKIKLKQAKQRYANLNAVCSEKESIIASLENKLFIDNDSALSRLNDHHSLKLCLSSLQDEFLLGKQQRQQSDKLDGEEMIKSLMKKISTLANTIDIKRKVHIRDMTRLKKEYSVLLKVSRVVLSLYTVFEKL